MGNRAVISVGTSPGSTGIYLHWNGGPESVLAFLHAARALKVRAPEGDSSYAMARLTQIIGNFFGGTLSLGIGKVSELDTNNGDNGHYIIGGDFEIIARKHTKDTTAKVGDLSVADRAKYEGVLTDAIKKNEVVFAGGGG